MYHFCVIKLKCQNSHCIHVLLLHCKNGWGGEVTAHWYPSHSASFNLLVPAIKKQSQYQQTINTIVSPSALRPLVAKATARLRSAILSTAVWPVVKVTASLPLTRPPPPHITKVMVWPSLVQYHRQGGCPCLISLSFWNNFTTLCLLYGS